MKSFFKFKDFLSEQSFSRTLDSQYTIDDVEEFLEKNPSTKSFSKDISNTIDNQTDSSYTIYAKRSNASSFAIYRKGPCSIIAVAAILGVTPKYLWNELNYRAMWYRTKGLGVTVANQLEFLENHGYQYQELSTNKIRNFLDIPSHHYLNGYDILEYIDSIDHNGKYLIHTKNSEETEFHVGAVVKNYWYDTAHDFTYNQLENGSEYFYR